MAVFSSQKSEQIFVAFSRCNFYPSTIVFMALKSSFRPNLLESEEKFGFWSFSPPFWGPESSAPKMTKNGWKIPKMAFLSCLMGWSNENNCKPSLETKEFQFLTFLINLRPFFNFYCWRHKSSPSSQTAQETGPDIRTTNCH